jgi:hypothetical protein
MRNFKKEVIELAERVKFSIVSSWTEYLTLSSGQSKKYLIAPAGSEALAETHEFFNEDKDDYDEIPEEINGQKVVQIEGEYIVGGPLIINSDYSGLEFDDPSDPELSTWLIDSGWDKLTSNDIIKKALQWGWQK